MKLRAVRLSEVGHFREGVALEGLSGGFDVLAGPNEFGKSTIFKAIGAAFRWEHTSARDEVRELAPNQGGAPLVEVDFECGDQVWRIRKRYLQQRSATLVALGGSKSYRGADAENQLNELLRGKFSGGALKGLLWVEQKQSFELPDPAGTKYKGLPEALGRLIEDEIADAGGGELARRMREVVNKSLDQLVQRTRRQAKAGSAYKVAIDDSDQAKRDLETAEAAALAANNRQKDLEAALRRIDDLRSPEAADARDRRRAKLISMREKILDAEAQLRLVQEVLKGRDSALADARRRRDELKRDIEDAVKARKALDELAPEKLSIDAELERLIGHVEELRTQGGAARAHFDQLQQALQQQTMIERIAVLDEQIATLTKIINELRTLKANVEGIDAALAGEPVTGDELAKLKKLDAEIERLRAQLAAGMPRVSIVYKPGSEGRLRLKGERIPGSGDLPAAETVVIDVEGIGAITILAPTAVSSAGENLGAILDAAIGNLNAELARLGLENLAAAEVRHEARTKLVKERERAKDRIGAMAPDGVNGLERKREAAAAERASLLASKPAADDGPPSSRAAISSQLAQVQQELTRLDQAEAKAQEHILSKTKRHAQVVAQLKATSDRLSELEQRLPLPAERVAALQAFADEVETLAREVERANQDRVAWQSMVPDANARAKIDVDLRNAERSIQENASAIERQQLDIRGYQSALERDQQDGVEAKVVEMREQYAAARGRVQMFETEVNELELIENLLKEQDDKRRETELAPVLERLQALAAIVLPGARFQLSDKLAVSGLMREGSLVRNTQLSTGTWEQIAVLVRLAYGRLLADRGHGMPLILDDALVYSDDARFAAMLSVLVTASSAHQVILLTCQQQRFEALAPRASATMIELKPWKAD